MTMPDVPGESPPTAAAATPPPTASPNSVWHSTAALRRAIVVSAILATAAAVGGRVDLVVLVAPFVLGSCWALRRRPQAAPAIGIAVPDHPVVEGEDLDVEITVRNSDEAAYDVVVAGARHSPWFATAESAHEPGTAGAAVHPDRQVAFTVRAAGQTAFLVSGCALRWGWHTVGPAYAHAAACDGLLASGSVSSATRRVQVFPQAAPFEAEQVMPRAAGLVGSHRSRRYGDGGELAGIRQYAPGDRLRRIDWRTSLRARELHITQTLSDRDAELVVVLDVLHEAGPSGGLDGQASVLDTTVRAAAGIAGHYLGRGDRIRLAEYGGRSRALRPGSGQRHRLAILEWLLAVEAGERQHGPSLGMFGRSVVPASALVVVLTPLVDPRSSAMLAELARSGRSVVAVDTLPADVSIPRRDKWSEVAFGLWRVERRTTTDLLLQHGVPTVAWSGPGSLDVLLRDVARMAAAPKVVAR